MNKLDEIYADSQNGAEYSIKYTQYLCELLQSLDHKAVGQCIERFLDAREKGKKIIFIGNGGSAATSSHFANDLAIGPRDWERPFRAVSLTDNVAVLTALGNDLGYQSIFSKQLVSVMEEGDLVVAISASGNSPNLIEAVEYAQSKGNHCIGLTGFDGGKLKQMADSCIHIPTRKGEYGPVEDMHMVLDHLMGTYLMRVIGLKTE